MPNSRPQDATVEPSTETPVETKEPEAKKSPSLFAKLLAPFNTGKPKVEKRAKSPKSPKRDKKKDLVEVSLLRR